MDFIKANRKLKVNSDQKKKLLESLRKDSEVNPFHFILVYL